MMVANSIFHLKMLYDSCILYDSNDDVPKEHATGERIWKDISLWNIILQHKSISIQRCINFKADE